MMHISLFRTSVGEVEGNNVAISWYQCQVGIQALRWRPEEGGGDGAVRSIRYDGGGETGAKLSLLASLTLKQKSFVVGSISTFPFHICANLD